MNKLERFIFLILIAIAFFFTGKYFIWWIEPTHIPHNVINADNNINNILNIILFFLLTFVLFLNTILKIANWKILQKMSSPKWLRPELNKKVAFLTCFVPGDEPIEMLKKTLIAIKEVRYPHDTWVLDEGNTPEVKELCEELGVFHFSRKGKRRYNLQQGKFKRKTKGGNLNAWRDNFEKNYDFVAQVDMDHLPEKNFFRKTLGHFRNPQVGFVGMPQIYKNQTNWISKGAAEQSYFFYGPLMKGLNGYGMPFLIGTSHVYRVKAMQDIDGYAGTIAEDHLTGMKFHSRGWKSVYVDEILAKGNGPLNWVDYFNQQMRWSYGLFEIFFKYSPKLLKTMHWKNKINYFLLQLFYLTGVATIIGIILTILYLLLGINSTDMRVSDWINYFLPSFILGEIVTLYVHKFRIDNKNEPKYGLFGMLLAQGANIIYAIAFMNFLLGRKLTYLVTKKSNHATKPEAVPLRTFSVHIILSMITIIAILMSYKFHHDSLVLRFWGMQFVLLTTIIITSNYVYNIATQINQFKATIKYFTLKPISLLRA